MRLFKSKNASIIKLSVVFFLFAIIVGNSLGQNIVTDVPIYVTPEQMYASELNILYDEVALSFSFLRETVGVRGRAMGDASVAVANDGAAINANNAGIAQIRKPHLLSYINLVENGTSFLGYVHPISDSSSFGSSATYARIPKYGEESTIVTIAYSWALQTEGDAFLGVGLKGFSRRSDAFNTNGVVSDFGLWVKFWESRVSVGIALQNVGPEIRLKVNDTQDLLKRAGLESSSLPASLVLPNKIAVPYNVKFGIAYRAQPQQIPLLLTGELDVPSAGFVKLSLGGELWLPGLFAIRFGYSSQSDRGPRYTTGLGFRANWVQWGYSYLINDDGGQNKHQIYLSTYF